MARHAQNVRSDKKTFRQITAKERLEGSTYYSDSRYRCTHLHVSPLQFQRCMRPTGWTSRMNGSNL